MIIAHFVTDKVIMHEYTNLLALTRGNIATAVMEAGSYVTSGLVVGAAVAGDSDQLAGGTGEAVVATLFVFTLCQITIVVFAFYFDYMTTYSQLLECHTDNAAAGINYASHAIAMGLIMYRVVMSTMSLLGFVIWTVLAAAGFILGRKAMDSYVIPGQLLDKEIQTDRNWGAALVSGAVALSMAMIFNTALRQCEYSLCMRISI